jgi:hypothetical protein
MAQIFQHSGDNVSTTLLGSSLPISQDSGLHFDPTITSLVALVPALLFLFLYAGKSPFALKDKAGHKIPDGPRGLPIVGKHPRNIYLGHNTPESVY